MRKLIYVPVIHEESDLGSAASSVKGKSREACGGALWERHHEIVALFWENIRKFFNEIDPKGLLIYQDGLMTEGEPGHKIIREAAKRGSTNYQIVLDLINRGGTIKKTENIELLKMELQRILQLVQADSALEKDTSAIQNEFDGDRLMEERDRFVAKSINETLKNKGALFMGAYHHVRPYLEYDIEIIEIKNIKTVRDYFKTLNARGPMEKFDKLAAYMVSPVRSAPSEPRRREA